ncbi:hypothetical protein IU451_29010 [Nocardia cyriacigeorgica]|uniref:hypothetical protein n=1 Tax=Nocardia cyriacigeorgica TaxID=135487 RepID=UPI001895D503|nr:hypothetical protein [Nocardia cyriacigeorgica]MBF6326544.1 hypothetical protein [Nocardia cyriacigeorgica]
MAKPKRGYIVLVKGLDDGYEWEAAYTSVFTSRREADRERAQMRRRNRETLTFATVSIDLPEEAA